MRTQRPTGLRAEYREVHLDVWADPEVVFTTLLSAEQHSFWLDNGIDSSTGRSYLGSPSPDSSVAVDRAGSFTVQTMLGQPVADSASTSLFDLLRSTTAAVHVDSAIDDGTFRLGWVGWFGYEFGARLVGSPAHHSPLPDAALMLADRAIVFDHAAKTISLRTAESESAADVWLDETARGIEQLADRDRRPEPPPGPLVTARLRHTREEYLGLLSQCHGAITRGDAYQICLTNEIIIDAPLDALDTYLRLRRRNPSHHGGFLRFQDVALVSSSPEQFLDIRPDGRVTTSPIKGTRPRGRTPAEDRGLADELLTDPKEIAENVMIVDLMRNDLNRVAVAGTVEVSALLEVQSYANVHQLVSTVGARLEPGHSWLDAVEASLPAGSMTGAPKHSAMTIIDRLEGAARGPYAGVFGYIGRDGRVDLAVTIRSLVVGPGGASIGTGGGITASSIDEDEYLETLLKAAPLLAAANATL